MSDQINYYNRFGEQHEESILSCPEPEFWTTDYEQQGRVFREMKERIKQQEELILLYFNTDFPVLDVGCGFGRQAILLAKKGFFVTGTDTSNSFISIAKKLFDKFSYSGNFVCADIINGGGYNNYKQILLLDVLEHIRHSKRRKMLKRIHEIGSPGAILIISLPHIKKRITSQINNSIRRRITQHFSFFLTKEEHPYPVPSRKNILKLVKVLFTLERSIESTETDYYVFKRI